MPSFEMLASDKGILVIFTVNYLRLSSSAETLALNESLLLLITQIAFGYICLLLKKKTIRIKYYIKESNCKWLHVAI